MTKPPFSLNIWLRSLAFWIVFPISIILFALLLMLCAPFSMKVRWAVVQVWVGFILWWLKVTCNLTHEVQGLENIPSEPGIIYAKHQSTWETIGLQTVFPMHVWVAKHELLWVPFFGWGLALMNSIHIKRGTGKAAVRQLVTQGTERLKDGFWIVIFPEGTRSAAGAKGNYRIGGAVLAEQSGYPLIPLAHNAGEYWPRRSFLKYPGVIQVRIGAPISPQGKKAQQLLEEASGWIEDRMEEITTLK
ncbi:MAG: 1-acyl-sn-glycerol-3-phosphate acyltransferase [Gammaproteobacteria bacterium]|nr:1-acyl-sn-glycerol-3-phosphate acyltransferase [Gammaproteobacteria bacterium]